MAKAVTEGTEEFAASRIPKIKRSRPSGVATQTPTSRYLRDTGSRIISTRSAPLTSHRDDVRRSWTRVAGLAMDMIQNSGRLKGAVDQVIADTVGVGLQLVPQPDLKALGYSEEEAAEWIRTVKRRWRTWWLDAKECDARGKLTGPQMVDIALRWHIAFGEATGIYDYFDPTLRSRYGIVSGTKLRLYPPSRLVQETSALERIFQGVRHDDIGRAVGYRFKTKSAGFDKVIEYPAFDADGRVIAMHVFDAKDSEDVRGVSEIAAAIRKHIQAENLDDATLQMAILQTQFAVTLMSDAPSQDAFEALEALKEAGEEGQGYATEYLEFLAAKLDQAADSRIAVGTDPQISHLGPGEKLTFESAGVPGPDHLPFSNSLMRDMARAIGCTFGGLTMDYSDATYASVRMEVSSIWPVVMRRRERSAAPICQMSYANWLDEEIGEGRIDLKGGYDAFLKHKSDVTAASWQGPPQPTADDQKAARASSERLENGTSSLAIETAHLGYDHDELFEARRREHIAYVEAGMESPYAARDRAPIIETEPAP